MIKSFAELKRSLTVGTELTLIWSYIPDHKYLNTTRKVIKQQTNAVQLEGGSWLNMGAMGETAKNFSYQDDGFSVLDNNGNTLLTYKIEGIK